MSKEMYCHICGEPTDCECRSCGLPVCEEHMVPYTLYNQIDFCLCKDCYTMQEDMRIDSEFAHNTKPKNVVKKIYKILKF